MNSQTTRRPQSQRPTRSSKPNKYTKQTARFEGKRDGKPLLFGWGGHLSHNQKVQLQRRATWITAISLMLLVVVVIVGFWVNITIITPGLPITSVNGHQIPQSLYRKMVALQAQLTQNKLLGPHGLTAQRDSLRKQIAVQQNSIVATNNQITSLNKQMKALNPGPSTQRTSLTDQLTTQQKQLATEQTKLADLNKQSTLLTQTTIPAEQTNYTQSQVGNDSVSWLQDDELIREWLATQNRTLQDRINPTSIAVSRALNDFKANLPTTTNYNAFLSKDGVSDADIQGAMTVKLRRDNMQTYLATLVVSPTYQVLARTMTIDTAAHAQKILDQLKHDGNFGKLAKANSQDANTSSQGGSLGWLARGQYAQTYTSALVENWLFDSTRKIDELSPILNENGASHIVQILGIDPARAIDATTLQTLKNNALSNWRLEQQSLPGVKITPADQDKLLDPLNLPSDLPAAAPSGQGVPGSGIPAGGLPSTGGGAP